MGKPVLELKVDGQWLRSYGAWGDLTYSFSWPGGMREVSWTMTAKYGSRLSILRGNKPVEVFWCGVRQGVAYLEEPDWNGTEVSLTANGLFRLGEKNLALVPSGASYAPTSNPNAAIYYAGPTMGWISGATIPNVDLPGEPDGKLNTVTDVMDAHAERLGQRWQVDENFIASMTADPTEPSYLIRQGAGDLGLARDNYSSHVAIWYLSADTGVVQLAVYPSMLRGGVPTPYETTYGHVESALDITDRGPIYDADATSLAQNVYNKRQRPGFTNSLTLGRGEILNLGWRPIHPAAVRPNRMAWKLGTPDEVNLTAHTPFVIGATEYRDGEDTVTVTPVDKVSRTDEEVLTELLEAMEGGV